MLRKNHRLSREEFDEVFKSGSVSHSPTFMKRTMKTSHWSDYGVAVVVSKKIAKKAADRNKLKRKVYAIVREIVLSLQNPERCILIFKRNPALMTKAELKEELQQIFGV